MTRRRHWPAMLRYVKSTIFCVLRSGVIVTSLMFIAVPTASSSGDTCLDSKAFLERKFEAFGMLATTDTLIAVIRDSTADHEERYLSLIVLGCSGDQRMAPVMLEALNDANRDVRAGVIIGMRHLKSPQAVSPMVAIVRDQSEDETIRQIASGVLSQIAVDDTEVAVAIGEAARDEAQNLNVRLNHIFSLGRLTSEASTVELMGLLEDDNPDMLATTAIALAKHDVDESVPYLVGAVLSPQVQFWLRSKAGSHLEHLVDQDFSFTTGYGFKRTGRAVTGDELEPALAEIHDWWQENKDKYQ